MDAICSVSNCPEENNLTRVGIGRLLCPEHYDLYLLHPQLSSPGETVEAFLSKMQGAGVQSSEGTNPMRAKVTLESEMAHLINRHSLENGSNTPDSILAQYLYECLVVFNQTVKRRDVWHGYGKPKPDIHAHTAPKCDCGAAPDRPHTHGIGRAETPNLGEAA